MKGFFNLTEHHDVQIPMYGMTHLITVIVLILLLAIVLWKKEAVKKLVANKKLVNRILWVYILLEAFYWILIWGSKIEPMYERFPLHLCGSLSILMPILILTGNKDLFRFFSYWSISAGFISYANPGFVFYEPMGWGFFHYLLRHYFLFLAPIIIQIGWGIKNNYRIFTFSWTSLAVYAFLIFLLDWATGANYMHLGQHNPLEVPFLPKSFTVWPWSYPSFVAVGIVLLHLSYFSFVLIGRKSKVQVT